MRVAFIHNHPPGGAARAMHELGKQLAQRHDIDVYHLSSADEEMFPSTDYARRVQSFEFAERWPIRLGLYLNELRRYGDLSRLERVYKALSGAVDREGYDVVLVNACRFLQAPSVLRYLTTRSVYYCHEPPRRFLQNECRPERGPLTRYQQLRSAWHWPARKVLDAVLARRDRVNVAAAKSILTNSRFTASLIQMYYGVHADVCQLGVDTTRFVPSLSRGDYVISVGAVEPHKGSDFIVRSIARLPEGVRPRLVIVANYANPGVNADLQRLAGEMGVVLEVRLAVSGAELESSYRNARVFAYAPHREPFGLAALEAMACGIPVVAVAEGGLTESVRHGETGLLTARNEDAFAAALQQVIAGDGLAAALGQRGRSIVLCDWTWEAAGRRLEAHLQQVAEAVQRRNETPGAVVGQRAAG